MMGRGVEIDGETGWFACMKLAHVLLGAGRLETWGFPSGSAVKNLPVMEKTQETLGRFPGGGHGNALQSSCLEYPTERGVWQATVHGVAKSRIQLSNWAHRLETQGGNFQLRSWGRIPSQANFSLCSSGLQLIGWGPPTLLRIIYLKSTDCCYSIAQPCPILCTPMDCSMPGFPVLHCLLELAQTHVHWVSNAIQPPHLLSPLSPLALNLSQHQRVFQWVSFLYQVAKVLELQQVLKMNIQGWFPW